MGIERTLVLIKPDAVAKGVQDFIIHDYRMRGYNDIRNVKVPEPDPLRLREHYRHVIEAKCKDIPDIERRILKSMTEGALYAIVMSGNQAIDTVRRMAGDHTEPIKCAPGTFRARFSNDDYATADKEGRSVHNVIHTSDSYAAAAREISIWFGIKCVTSPETLLEVLERLTIEQQVYVHRGIETANETGEQQQAPLAGDWRTGSLFTHNTYPTLDLLHHYCIGEEKIHQTLALARAESLVGQEQLDGRVFGAVQAKDAVVVDVEVHHPRPTSRMDFLDYAKFAETYLLSATIDALRKPFKPGSAVSYKHDIRQLINSPSLY